MIAVRLGSNCLGFRWNLRAKSYRANLNFTIPLSKERDESPHASEQVIFNSYKLRTKTTQGV